MTLLELLKAFSFTTPLLGAILEGIKSGPGGIVAGLLLGLVLGVFGYLGTRATERWMGHHSKISGALSGWWVVVSNLLCVAIFVWILAVSILSVYLTGKLLR